MQRIRLRNEPSLLKKHEAFPYQLEAVEAIKDLDYSAVFHEQGLGKTKIAFDTALYWLENKTVDTVLFVTKKSLIANWQREFSAHTSINPRVLVQDSKKNYFAFNSPARVMLTHYEVIKSEEARLGIFLKTRDVAIIIDESAKIKNPESSLTQSFFRLGPLFKKKMIMTGTPSANRPYDIWAQICFLDKGESLGRSFAEFKRQADLSNQLSHDISKQREFESFVSTINSKISAFSVRETKDSGVITLPGKEFVRVDCDFESKQLELYSRVRAGLKTIVLQEGIPVEDNAEQLLKKLVRLIQVASNPRLVDEGYSAVPGKLEYLKDIVSKIVSNEEKCIVWTSFTENVDSLDLDLRGYGSTKVHGKMTMEARNASINKFLNDPAVRVLIATPGVAKEGLTLTVANHVIYYDRGFSLDDYLQSQDRIHRISQKKTCYVYTLVMKDSIDEWVELLLHSKHVAAKLAQGDISLETFKATMSYEFGDVIKSILKI